MTEIHTRRQEFQKAARGGHHKQELARLNCRLAAFPQSGALSVGRSLRMKTLAVLAIASPLVARALGPDPKAPAAPAAATAAVAVATPLAVGAPAPDLAAKDQDAKPINLKDVYAKGPTLVYFYPKADTPGCTKQG